MIKIFKQNITNNSRPNVYFVDTNNKSYFEIAQCPNGDFSFNVQSMKPNIALNAKIEVGHWDDDIFEMLENFFDDCTSAYSQIDRELINDVHFLNSSKFAQFLLGNNITFCHQEFADEDVKLRNRTTLSLNPNKITLTTQNYSKEFWNQGVSLNTNRGIYLPILPCVVKLWQNAIKNAKETNNIFEELHKLENNAEFER